MIVMLYSINGIAQKPRVHYFINYDLGISYRVLTGDDRFAETLDDLEAPMATHGAEVNMDIPFTRRLGVNLGIGFQTYGMQFTIDYDNWLPPDNVGDPSIPDFELNVKDTYNYLTLPLNLRTSVLLRRHSSVNFLAGPVANVFLGAKQKSTRRNSNGESEVSKREVDRRVKDLVLGGNISLLYTFDIERRVYFNLGVGFKMMFMNINSTDFVKQYPYSSYIRLGIGI